MSFVPYRYSSIALFGHIAQDLVKWAHDSTRTLCQRGTSSSHRVVHTIYLQQMKKLSFKSGLSCLHECGDECGDDERKVIMT